MRLIGNMIRVRTLSPLRNGVSSVTNAQSDINLIKRPYRTLLFMILLRELPTGGTRDALLNHLGLQRGLKIVGLGRPLSKPTRYCSDREDHGCDSPNDVGGAERDPDDPNADPLLPELPPTAEKDLTTTPLMRYHRRNREERNPSDA